MDHNHALWVERGYALGDLLIRIGNVFSRPAERRPVLDFPADARDAARYSAEIALAMRNGRQLRSETLRGGPRRLSRFFQRLVEVEPLPGAVVIPLPEVTAEEERRTGTR